MSDYIRFEQRVKALEALLAKLGVDVAGVPTGELAAKAPKPAPEPSMQQQPASSRGTFRRRRQS